MRMLLMSAALLMGGVAPAMAGEDLKAVPSRLDPDQAYLLVDIISDPAGDIDAAVLFARYDRERQDIRGLGRASASPVAKGEDLRVGSKPGRSVRPKGNGGLHLFRLTPGIWTIEAVAGTANSLGSYSFDLPAGSVTDLGVIAVSYTDYEGKPVDPMGMGRVFKMALMAHVGKTPELNTKVMVRERNADDAPLPGAVAALTPQKALLQPGARFGNYTGGMIARIDGQRAVDAQH